MTSIIDLPKTVDTGSFARYVPFGDGREVIVRRGEERGFHYGLELGRKRVTLDGGAFELVRFQGLLSPPPLLSGRASPLPQSMEVYRPVAEVLFLPDAEVLMRRAPGGFSDAEVESILDAISVR
jgi:hypothetical protein